MVKTVIIFLTSVLFMSCLKEVEEGTREYESVPFIDFKTKINSDSSNSVCFINNSYRVDSPSSNDYKPINNASVIFKDGANYTLESSGGYLGYHLSHPKLKDNKTYNIEIELEDGAIITASEKVPVRNTIDTTIITIDSLSKQTVFFTIDVQLRKPLNYGNIGIEMDFKLNSDDSVPNLFLPLSRTFIKLSGPTSYIYSNESNIRINGEKRLNTLLQKHQNIFDDYNFYVDSIKANVHVSSISKDYFDFLSAGKISTENYGDPFAEPIFVPSNVKNALGYFSVINIDWKKYNINRSE